MRPFLSRASRAGRERLRLLVEGGGDVGGGYGVDVRAHPRGDRDIGHRAEVLPLPRRRALVARAEEADRELRLRLGGGDQHVVEGDRRARSAIPDRLAVGLDEVGIAAGRGVHRFEGLGGEGRVLALGRRGEGAGPPRRARAGRCAGSGRAARSRTSTRTARRAGAAARRRPRSPAGPFWLISWQAAHRAETSSGPRSCISSMKIAMPLPTSAASPPMSVKSSTRSISMSPESARPRTAGASMPGLHWSFSLAPVPASRWANDLITPSTWSTLSGSVCPSSRTAWCSALLSGRRSPWSGRASSLPVPQRRRTAAERSALSSTVLPTPRSPVSTSERSGRPLTTRSSTTSKAASCSSRPASSGGRWPAPGA